MWGGAGKQQARFRCRNSVVVCTQACFANTSPLIANPPQIKKLTEAKAEAEEIAAATMQKDEFEAKCPAVFLKFYQLRALTTQDWAVPLPPEGDDV